ncbi:pre-mRNA processing RNA-helicase [Massospora cicadina]|nr:pre-mRNA processing RNA-helicase [Massospora cicadina]
MAKERARTPSPSRSKSPSKRRKRTSSQERSRRSRDREDSRDRRDRKERSRRSEKKSSRSNVEKSSKDERRSRRSKSRSPRVERHRTSDKEREITRSRRRSSRENSREGASRRDRDRHDRPAPFEHRGEDIHRASGTIKVHSESNVTSSSASHPLKSSHREHTPEANDPSTVPESVGLSTTTKSLLEAQEEKIRQRRERVEKWRKEREEARLRELEANASEPQQENVASKVWSLEDDEDDDEPPAAPDAEVPEAKPPAEEAGEISKAASDSEEDPLEAYMQDIKAESEKILKLDYEKLQAKDREWKSASRIHLEAEEVESEESEPEDILALAAKKIKKKDVPTIDHGATEYEPFRKNFYIEPFEMQNMTEEEVELYRAELDGIKIRGVHCPKPIKRWTHCGFPAGCLEVIRKQNFTTPTPIQAQAIPAVMSGRDVIGVAKTGSGKTLAFLLPMFRHIRDQRPLENGEGPIAIIMTPTRELATQIHRECKPFLKVLGFKAVCIYGGTGMQNQINDIKRGAEIVVCTPGRMIDFLCTNSGRLLNLTRVTFLVLDEADRMFDMGFEPQVMRIVSNVRPDRQTVLFSATFPRQMEALARKILKKPLEITVGGRSVVCNDVAQVVEVREEKTKFTRLLEILGNFYQTEADEEKRTLIFVDRQDAADNLLRDLLHKGYVCMSLHGGKDQVDRDATIADFKAGACTILIATSIAARGLDIKNLALVVNYECPNHMEDYVHRVGRTGRAGNKGTAYTFITPAQDRYANDIVKALKASNTPISNELQRLADEFGVKVKTGYAHQAGSGFGGKGLETLDKQRDLVKLVQKKTYGNNEDDSDPSSEEDLPGTTQTSTTGSLAIGALAQRAGSIPASLAAAAIQAAQLAAAKVSAAAGAARHKDTIAELTAKFRGDPQLLNDLLDHLNPPPPVYSTEIEINDFPQKARWRVTNKETINQITEHTGAAITTRGEYIASHEPLPFGSTRRKLHLFIEADNQIAVDLAVREIKSLLKEATLLAFETENRAPRGRDYRPLFGPMISIQLKKLADGPSPWRFRGPSPYA